MKGWVTVNTDAGFYPREKVGSYAYWIKADGLFLRGSGIFKGESKSSLDCEVKAIVNALAVLFNSGYKPEKIIVNRDNIYANKSVNIPAGNKLKTIVKQIKKRSIPNTHHRYADSGKDQYIEFRHVKAHSHTKDAKHFVNDWCDKRCKEELRKWKAEQILNNNQKTEL